MKRKVEHKHTPSKFKYGIFACSIVSRKVFYKRKCNKTRQFEHKNE